MTYLQFPRTTCTALITLLGCLSASRAPAGDAAIEASVDALLAKMTLEEKIGQMIQADIASISPADLQRYHLGSILAGGNAAPGGNIRTSPAAWLDLTDEFFRAAAGTDRHPAIPILFGIDAVHGNAKLVGATIFPHNIGLGAAHEPELVQRIGAATAAEVAAIGIDWTFAPTVAVVRDVRWGRSYESYSEAPDLVARYAPAMVIGLQGALGTGQFMAPGHTLSSVKHFLGDGGTRDGRDQGDTVLAEAELQRVHAAGYLPAFDAGAMIVMASYNSWNGVKLHGNRYLLTDVLKGRLGFDGFVIGDWNAQEQLPGCTKSDCPAAYLAGIDMLMAPDSWQELYRNTLAEARSGVLPSARIDDAVRRILRVKTRAGLFERQAPKQRSDAGHFEQIGSAAHRELAREAVRKSLVLLKNAHGILPLNARSKVLVTGDGADDVGMQAGGWTVDWQGNANARQDFPGAQSIFEAIKARVEAAGGEARLSRDGSVSVKPDVAIVVFGETPYAEFQGDRETLEFEPHAKRALRLLRRLRSRGIPIVSVFLSGRPMWVNAEINASDAFVAAWLPGSEGGGVADVLLRSTGDAGFEFTGSLSFSWPDGPLPVQFGPDDVSSGALFSRGYGLHYGSADAQVTLRETAATPARYAAPVDSLFFAAHPTAPWSLFVADRDAEVHVTTERQASPHTALEVQLTSAGAQAAWSGREPGSLRITGRRSDLRRRVARGDSLRIHFRVDSTPQQPVLVGVQCTSTLCGSTTGALVDMTHTFREAPLGEWREALLPLACLTRGGADLGSVEVPLVITTAGRFTVTLGDARLLTATGRARGTPTCPR